MPDAIPESFFADPAAFANALRVTDPAYRSGVAGLLARLAGFGIAHSRVTVDDFHICAHAGLREALLDFLRAHPAAPLPLEQIIIARPARRGSGASDLEETRRQLEQHADGIEFLSRRCNLDVRLHVFVEEWTADAAAGLAAAAQASRLDGLAFYFQYPSDPDSAALRDTLAQLCAQPAFRDPRLMLGNFPFCFYPAGQFRHAYRETIEPLKGHIGAQRDLARKLASPPAGGSGPCAGCRCRAACHALTDVASQPAYAPHLRPRREEAVLFAGGSITPADVPLDPALVWTGPADQGSLLAAVLEGFRTVLIVDGYFYTRFPCTTFEVMLALEAGRRVLGASSIGALRAAELESHGMEGAGYVFDFLRRQPIKPYHVVAQTYDERDRPVTPPPIQIRYFLEAARDAGVIDAAEFDACCAALEEIHFLELSFPAFFRRLDPARAQRLRDFQASRPADAFDIKKRDALALLDLYRRGPDPDRPRYPTARSRSLAALFEQYRGEPDLTLPEDWAAEADAAPPAGQDRRAVPAAETVRRAERFFAGLGVTVADTSRYDPSGQLTLSVFYPAFYHLDYYPSSATGNGDTRDEALASAYMELVERLPAGGLHLRQRSLASWGLPPLPAARLPQFYNWGVPAAVQEQMIGNHGYVRVTDILAGRPVLIPKPAVMFAYSGTDGLAAGNTPAEAILYALYELIERDTGQLHLVDPELRRRQPEFLLDPAGLADPRARAVLDQAAAKGCRFLLYQLPNVFELPCVMVQVYDETRGIQCHGGIAVRAGFDAAAYAALREAYMQYITYFAGTRDDYRAFAAEKRAQLLYEEARDALFPRRGRPPTRPPAGTFSTVRAELDHVLARLDAGGITSVLVADTSPLPRHQLCSVKVIVPGLDLWFCPDYVPSEHLRRRADRVRAGLGAEEPA